MTETTTTRQPAFYAHDSLKSIIRVHDYASVDRWTPLKGWREADAETTFEDLTSPQWHSIPPEQAQVRINRWGGSRTEFMDKAKPAETPPEQNTGEALPTAS